MNRRSDENTRDGLSLSVTEAPNEDTINGEDRTLGAMGASMSTSAAGDRSTEHQFDDQSVDGVSVRSFLEGFRINTNASLGGTATLRTISEAEVAQLAKRLDRNLAADGVNMLIGHYFVTRLLGSGGMGRVFAAIDTRLNREVALKLLHSELTASERGKVRLVREAQAMAKVSHPNVAAVYEVGESDDCFYVTMELVKGVTLRDWLRTSRSWREVVELFIQAGNGLAAAHEVGLVHRDFKPENVMLGDDGRVRVLDFGLAFLRASQAVEGDDDSSAEPRKGGNALVGTVAYMSPEQFLAEALDARSDQFSFCVSLFEALFGHRPFAGRTVGEIVHNTIAGNLELQPMPAQLPSWVIAVLRKGMSTERANRYASMGELVELLEAGRATPWLQVPRLAHESARDRLAARLRCSFEGALVGVGPVALWRARRQASNEPLLIALPLDVDDERARTLLSAYFEKTSSRLASHALPAPRQTGALDCAALLRPTELVTEGQLVALVFEDLEAVALEGFMQRKTPVELSLTLRVAIQLTNALHLLTLAGLPVEHVRLGGALVHTSDHRVLFFDPQLLDARALVDAPRYRQVGMAMQRMLSSSTSSDAVAFDEHLPSSVKQIIELLLHPTNSYRSARGLAHDLETCLGHARSGASKRLPIATRDVSDRFAVSDVIRGRKDAIEAFRAISRRVQEGAAGLFLLSGPPGIGKSALVELLCSELDHARRIKGKFDQFGNNEPYATIVQALRELVQQLGDDPRDFRGRILEAVAPNAALLFSVIPEIRSIIGEQPPVATLPPAEASIRFRETLKNLIRAFASPVETLVIVLDDMQWCDPASLEFITSMLDDEVAHILWLGAFREQEVTPEHPLRALLDGLASHAPLRQAVRLGPLDDAELRGLIADTLACPEERTAKLATFVRDRTDGNPLFAQTLLASLHEQGLFVFSPREECWTWDDEAIRSAELPDDLLDLIGRKIEKLSAAARLLLSSGSCIGRDIEAEVLLDVCVGSQSRAALEAALDECVAHGLLSSTFVRSGGESMRILNFTHDRVQQTAWQSLDDEQRSALNLEIGCKLLERASPDELQAKLFRIVGHLNAGVARASGALRDRIIELDLTAGKRALVANAFADAAKFLQTALSLLPEDLWKQRYEQAVELHVAYMHAESLLGNREREDEIFEILRKHVTTTIHLSEIYELKVMLDSSRGEHALAITRAREGLEMLGERLPRLPGPLAAMIELARTGWALRGRTPEAIAEMEASAQEDAGVARLLVALSSPAYLTDSNLLVVVMMRIVRQALRSGVTNVSSHGFAGYGLVLSGLLGKSTLAERFGAAALRLNERFNNPWLQPKVDLITGIFILPWTQPFAAGQDLLARGLKIALENADFPYASYNATSMVCVMYYRGLPLDHVIQVATTSLRHTQRAGHYDMEVVVSSLMRACMCLRGQTASPSDYSGEGFDEAKFLASIDQKTTPVGTFFHRAIKVAVLYLHGRFELACELGREATSYEANAFSNPSRMECRFYYAMALCRLPELSGRERRMIKRVFTELQKRAALCPANFAARYELLAAELARVSRKGDVLSHLNTAIEAARSHGNTHYEALGSELAAAHCASNNQHSIARVYLKSSIEAYQRWGAVVKVRELEKQLPAELPAGGDAGASLAPLGHG
jgi:predicted ATPase/serine/threonine protein kinase